MARSAVASRLLCVDDRTQLLQVRKTNLERCGFTVDTATSASAALASLAKTEVASVLLDYKREGLDPEAVAFHIRQRFPDQPILLLSAYSDMPERIFWLVDEYILRSESIERLIEIIERITQRRQAKKSRAAA